MRDIRDDEEKQAPTNDPHSAIAYELEEDRRMEYLDGGYDPIKDGIVCQKFPHPTPGMSPSDVIREDHQWWLKTPNDAFLIGNDGGGGKETTPRDDKKLRYPKHEKSNVD